MKSDRHHTIHWTTLATSFGVALFGALAGEGHVVSGLHASAIVAVGLLVALAAALLVPRRG